MKCIKNKKTGEIKRVTDELAYNLESKGWDYIPKSEWKKTTRPDIIVVEKVVNGDGKVRRNREKKNRK